MLFSDACADFLAHIQHERGLAARTISTYSDWFSSFRRWTDREGIGEDIEDRFNVAVLRRYLYTMSYRRSRPRTIRNAFAPLKSVGAFLVEQQAILSKPVLTLVMPKKDAAYRPVVSGQEVVALLDATCLIRDRRWAALARAMINLLAYTGLRLQELLDLEAKDVRLDLRTVTIQHGKGDKARTLHPAPPCLAVLSEWLHERESICAKHTWLWVYDTRRRMGEVSTRQLLEDVKTLAEMGGRRHIQPHAFRRFFASTLVQQAGLQSVSQALGHAELNTTYQYLSMAGDPARAMAHLTISSAPEGGKRPGTEKRTRHTGRPIPRVR